MKRKKQKPKWTINKKATAKALKLVPGTPLYERSLGAVLGKQFGDFKVVEFYGVVCKTYAFVCECVRCGFRCNKVRWNLTSDHPDATSSRICKTPHCLAFRQRESIMDTVLDECFEVVSTEFDKKDAFTPYFVADSEDRCACIFWNREGDYTTLFSQVNFDISKIKVMYKALDMVGVFVNMGTILEKYKNAHEEIELYKEENRKLEEKLREQQEKTFDKRQAVIDRLKADLGIYKSHVDRLTKEIGHLSLRIGEVASTND